MDNNKDEIKKQRDDALDESLEESFPASDPPANTVETGIAGASPDEADSVSDNRAASRFELEEGESLAFLVYERKPGALFLIHTEVPAALRHRHIGDALVRAALASARGDGLRAVAVCPFVQSYLRDHPSLMASSPGAP